MRPFIFILLCFVSLAALPQELISPVRSDLIPPAPASAAMIEAQMPKPSLLTGAAAFSIPLYTVEVDGFTMPITLQYHSNGVKVFDQTAPLGAGWSITPALRASRTVDFEGRRLMRREGAGSDWLSTYYIYDSFGRLRRVLQPMLEAKSYAGDDADLADFSFEYRYDGAGRCVYEHIPGVSPVRRRYSAAGRLVAEHLPAMTAGEWRLFYYDAAGRKVLEGVATLGDAALDSFVAGSHLVAPGADNDDTLTFGYCHAGGFPDEFQATSASYFDSYSYAGVIQPRLTVGGQWPVMHACGLPTGAADMGSDGEIRTESYYYDSLGRMIQSLSHAPEGNVAREMRHTYTGAVEREQTIVSRPDTSFVFAVRTEYDEGERQRSITYRLGDDSVTVRHTYNSAGLMARTDFGSKLAREYEYDIHGWPVKTSTKFWPESIGKPGGSLSQNYYSDISTRDIVHSKLEFDPLTERYTELMHYADGAVPRYTGEMSGRTTSFGSCYDYRYDAHDRLVGADYTAAPADTVGEDFSVSYTYDAIGRPLTLQRYGVTGIEGTVESFGLLDELAYSYDGALPSAITRLSEATDFYGRTGATATQLTFNAAGLLTADTGRSVTGVTYNHLGQPLKTTVSRPSAVPFPQKYIESNVYSSSGKLISANRSFIITNVGYPVDHKTHLANFTFSGEAYGRDTLTRVDFPWGYFDGRGVHWTLTDALGSVEMVIDNEGNVERASRPDSPLRRQGAAALRLARRLRLPRPLPHLRHCPLADPRPPRRRLRMALPLRLLRRQPNKKHRPYRHGYI